MLVTARSLTLGYDRHTALTASDFEIPSRGITVLIGPNGSGKSTVLAALAGLIEPMSGTISWAGGRRPRISLVLQATQVNASLPVTVREVVLMGRYPNSGMFGRLQAEDHRAVAEAMERMAITDLADRHLHELSGGQRQRVFVAQGLAQPHDVLMLDEPLTGLDIPAATTIDDVIHEEADGGVPVLLTSHDLAEARAADHVLLLSRRVVSQGPPEISLTDEFLAEAYGEPLHPNGDIHHDESHH